MDVIDLHCDLLSYLALNPNRNPLDSSPRCSVPQLQEGKVKTQTLAVSSETTIYSLCLGMRQLEIFFDLPIKYPEYFSKNKPLLAFENASTFCLETEPLEHVFIRLESIFSRSSPLYISLTWNGENRFGGGCGTKAGLKEDGKELLQFLSGRNIAIDFAHATDQLAHETLNFIDKNDLDLSVMASHSNFRAIQNHMRNLPDAIAKEIIKRDGLIGLVFYKKFLGNSPSDLFKHIEYGLKLGGEKSLAFGADFFCTEDFSSLLPIEKEGFFKEMSDASCYPHVIEKMRKEMTLSTKQISNISFANAQNFIAIR